MVHDRLPLVEGQGNFGRPPNIGAASSRYTESRMSAFTKLFISETPDLHIRKKALNYDERREYPVFLPVRLPLLLLNGAEGIALALSTRIPPQNLAEMIKCLLVYLQTNDIKKATKHILGPDYGNGKLISDETAIRDMYANGSGTLEFECVYSKTSLAGNKRLVVTDFCPTFNPESFLVACEKLIEDDIIDYARNESGGKNGDRITIGYSNEALLDRHVIPRLKKKVNYKFNLLVSDGNDGVKPVSMNLSEVITTWVDIRKNTIKLTLEQELKRLSVDIEKEQGKLKAIEFLGELFDILKSSNDLIEALIKNLGLTRLQAEAVAGMRVESLQKLSKSKIDEKLKGLMDEVAAINEQLSDISGVLIKQIKDIEKWANKACPELLKRGTAI
jgi:DNA gyrase/topoisomerase IV subunit A